VAHLHGGEVTVADEREVLHGGGRRRGPVDFDPDGWHAHGPTVNGRQAAARQ
jgi:hypothetical protein